jgi:hypothetical protein
MQIKNLQTLDEVLHYGTLGEVTITTQEDWSYIEQLILGNSESSYEAGMEYIRENEGSEAAYECGVEDGYREGYQVCLDKYGLEE